MENLEVGDLVLCTVEKIVRAMVFLKIDGHGQGGMILSEVAPGRIRNLRQYVYPDKRVICKVIRISEHRIDLSLRRVTRKNQRDFKEEYKRRRKIESLLKNLIKEKADGVVSEIHKRGDFLEFFEEAKENPKELEKLIGQENSKELLRFLMIQKNKKKILKKKFFMKSYGPEGLVDIKKVLLSITNAKIKYISAGEYSIKIESENLKEADQEIDKVFEVFKKESERKHIIFSSA